MYRRVCRTNVYVWIQGRCKHIFAQCWRHARFNGVNYIVKRLSIIDIFRIRNANLQSFKLIAAIHIYRVKLVGPGNEAQIGYRGRKTEILVNCVVKTEIDSGARIVHKRNQHIHNVFGF